VRRPIIRKLRGAGGRRIQSTTKTAIPATQLSAGAPEPAPSKNGSSAPAAHFAPHEAPTNPAVPKPSIEALIARSSLGTPGAVAVRQSAPQRVVESVVARVSAGEASCEPFDVAELDAVAAGLEASGALDAFEQQALEAWNDDSIELSAEDEQHIDAARVRVLAFAKDQALLDWLDEPELAADSQGHGATQQFAAVPAGGGATDVGSLRTAPRSSPTSAPPGEIVAPQNVPTPDDVYQHFVDGLTEQTRAAYGEDLEHFARWLGQPDSRAAVTHLFRQSSMQANQLVLGWANAMHAEGYAPSTRSRRMSALRAAVKLANAFGVINWQLHVRSPKVQKVRDTRGIEPANVRKMLEACDESVEGLRDRAMVLVLFTLGLRRIELVRLRVKHYDHVRRRLLVHGKGCERDPNKIKWRDVPLEVDAVLFQWLERGHGLEPDPEAALFFGWKNNHRTPSITPRGVHYVISKLGERVGVDVWPHSFRHSAVTTGLKEGHQLHEMQQFARHEDPATTQIYNDDVENAPGRVADTLMRVLKDK
jgi:integrase/recombinase XerC